ncbi:MAG: M48 family metallopeptidase [Deltaproteobacteria bacterium]|nr:M48 family metallopeptidase [Deltaproteobacteria bacterium]MBW2595105.1 M48 family metallopeptidase [Deltaproteobacteria bacterium]MBW2649465.1 M48 family metallopeptidase [Deltaproteobacteria bacterium]
MEQLKIDNITVDVVQKNIKNIHLRVYPPAGRVRISAPSRMDLTTIRTFVISKLGWIKKQQTRLRNQEREAQREFINRETHYFNGKRYLLKVTELNAAPKVVLKHSTIELYVRPETDVLKKKSVLDEWYRRKLKETVPALIEKWEKRMNVQINEFGIKKMKTRWGTCNRQAKRIWLNLELAKKPAECLEYIVVHEMAHLLERKHNDRFIALMTGFIPKWRFYKDELNRLPITHVDWNY